MSIEVKYPTCQRCGFTGKEVVKTIGYIGGLGYVDGYYCLDTHACWQRWELQQKQEGKFSKERGNKICY